MSEEVQQFLAMVLGSSVVGALVPALFDYLGKKHSARQSNKIEATNFLQKELEECRNDNEELEAFVASFIEERAELKYRCLAYEEKLKEMKEREKR